MALIPDPLDAPGLRWGFLGPGWIAGIVAECLRTATRQRLVAVGSRSAERAQAFAQRYDVPFAGTYEAVLDKPDVDVVYIATTNNTHAELATQALDAGKPVLLEKTITLDAAQAHSLASLAVAKGIFFMEAMWTRFLPHMVELRHRLSSGQLGELRYAHVDSGYRDPYDPASRIFSRSLGGGALLDRGIYPVSFIVDLFGMPSSITARSIFTDTGVDAHTTALLSYPNAHATAVASINVITPQDVYIGGTDMLVRLAHEWWAPTRLEFQREGRERDVWEHPTRARGYEYELAEVARCVAEGRTESPTLPVSQSVGIMEILDEIRGQCGITFDHQHPLGSP
ncbi:MAG: Gfo/Idh/MocA family oxidoreductase [Propionibacteriaceae bacterium]|jgi:predicted dehydrogenase|nr:Gfo/Idh/MocA family oxidoreductase [Propionibacteriaceae bacterium]